MKYSLFIFFFILSLFSFSQNDSPDSIVVKANTQIYLVHLPCDTTAGTFKIMDSIDEGAKAIRIKFGTKPAMGSVLEIFNPYEFPFAYKAFVYNFKKKKYIDAGVHPVQPKMGTRETWPFPTEYILIKEFKLEIEREKE